VSVAGGDPHSALYADLVLPGFNGDFPEDERQEETRHRKDQEEMSPGEEAHAKGD